MNITLKVLSLLLGYPESTLVEGAVDLKDAVRSEELLPADVCTQLDALIDELAGGDLLELPERYVELFDRTRSLSLHLFEHVHGESRDRGQAMVDLQTLYEQNGMYIEAHELPDYIPMFLEFLATQPLDEARALLSEPLHVLRALALRHRERDSPYASVFVALETLSNAVPEPAALAQLLQATDDDPNDFEALDRAWADEPVAFGPGESCTAALQQPPQARPRTQVSVAPPTHTAKDSTTA
ncbi:MAG: nitrate reductase delta subunit [Gammaproteobacteria bacterium]|jgi:nitrate reductase delta subunit